MLSQLSKLGLIGEPALFSNSFFLILNTFTGSLLGYLFWWINTRWLDSQDLGTAAGLFSAIAMIAALADMGLGVALTRYIVSLGKHQNGFINACLLVVSFFSLLFSLVYVIVFWLGKSGEVLRPTGFMLMLVFLLSCVFFGLAQFLDRIFVAFEVTPFVFLRNLILNISRVALIIFFVKPYGVLGVVVSIGIGALVSLVFSLSRLIPRAFSDFRLMHDFAWQLVKHHAIFSLGNHVAQLAWSIPVFLIPVLVLGIFGPLINGRFYLTWMVANFVYVIPGAISTVAFARFAHQENLDLPSYRKIFGFTLVLLIPAITGVMLASPIILGMFGQRFFAEGKYPLVWLLLASFPYTINIFAIVRFRMQESVQSVILVSGLILLASLVLLPLLGHVLGLAGLGIGWFLAQLVGCLWLVIRIFLDNKCST